MRSRWIVPFVVAVVAGEELVANVIKDIVDRARPTFNPAAATLGPSFPSGHTTTAAAFYAAAALLLGRGRPRLVRALLAGGAVGIAVAVAASRVLLDVHWLTRRDRRARARLGLVRDLRGRLRRPPSHVRRSCRDRRAGGRVRPAHRGERRPGPTSARVSAFLGP